ncbi:MAG: FHA domain-containing protein [Deltaproteobacteria bacterium]|nr:FHA domain-containing protein [Deltaproteobacteria bacterium]
MPARRARSRSGEVEWELRGAAGATRFGLERTLLVVGRELPADLVLEDDSVSRRHAELRFSGTYWFVHDLDSANGTFVDGVQVNEAPLPPGTRVRFGEVELVLSTIAPAREAPGARAAGPAPSKTPLLVVGMGGLAAAVLAAAFFLFGSAFSPRPPPSPPPTVVAGKPTLPEVTRLLGECLATSDPESRAFDPEAAARICAEVYRMDGTRVEARARARRAEKEIATRKLLEEARGKAETGQDEEALRLLAQVDKGSAFFGEAYSLIAQSAGVLLKSHRGECRGKVSAGFFEKALPHCTRALELSCQISQAEDRDTLALYRRALRHLGKQHKAAPLACPSGSSAESPRPDLLGQALRERYPDPKVAALVRRYVEEGKPRIVADELKRLRSAGDDSLSRIIQDLEIVEGRWATAGEPLQRGKAEACEATLKEAFEAETRLVPAGWTSALMHEIRVALAKAYLSQGRAERERGQDAAAFKLFEKGYRHDPQNTTLGLQLRQMERDGKGVVTGSPEKEGERAR